MKKTPIWSLGLWLLLISLSACHTIQEIPPTEAPPKDESIVDEEAGEEDENPEEEPDEHSGNDTAQEEDDEASDDDIPDLKDDEDAPTLYHIPKGEHYATEKIVTLSTKTLRFSARFDSTAIYETPLAIDQADVNKLMGMSDCKNHHHTNSARFGWRWYEETLQILAYTYVNGERQSSLITAVALNETYEYSIKMDDDHYVFQVGDKAVKMNRGCEGHAVGYMLYPYFGGNNTAPHDISIWIKIH